MKEKIGMEKLVELLNEYEPRIAGNGEHYDNIWWYRHFMSDKTVANNATRYIVSKEYGFIKWLVENDKINLGKIKKLYRKSNEHSTSTYPVMYEYSDLECLLMLLSISDTPIDYLCNLLFKFN